MSVESILDAADMEGAYHETDQCQNEKCPICCKREMEYWIDYFGGEEQIKKQLDKERFYIECPDPED